MLDQKLKEWREKITDVVKNQDPSGQNRVGRITVGDQAVKIDGEGSIRIALQNLSQEMTSILRDRMPPEAWPVSLCYACNSKNDVTLEQIHISGIVLKGYLSSHLVSTETVSWSRSTRTLTGLDRVAEDFDLLSRLTPPSNQPVRSWSMGHTIMGSPHIGHEGIHARTEVEMLLKMEWERYGREGLEVIIANKGLSTRRNDEKLFFVAGDLFDFDIDPEGKAVSKDNVRDDLARHIEKMDDTGPGFEP
ncbi:hypothetical protein [Pseudosulfitobacter pseudonitzschiae]|uniref:hypothetical protein n=1 Tax=Pseudosulfitobacter pseudonitzschiae TaxID=1402135 RepID=UPI003B8026A5